MVRIQGEFEVVERTKLDRTHGIPDLREARVENDGEIWLFELDDLKQPKTSVVCLQPDIRHHQIRHSAAQRGQRLSQGIGLVDFVSSCS